MQGEVGLQLTDLSRIAIPRCLRLANPEKVDLHLFSDASKAAFASSANLVCQYPDNSRSSRLIASKCRVAPVKALTIPRLELIGAVLSSRLAQSILKVLTVDRTIFWTNSENVWFWVRSQSREFKPFIANRIGEIQPVVSPEQWRHVPGTSNSADLPTRGLQLSAKELTDSKFWMKGPTFLEGDESAWPSIPPTGDTKKCDDLERLKITSAHLTYANPSINPVEFSSLKHLVRVTGWVRSFADNCRLPRGSRRSGRTLMTAETLKAETFWLKQAQDEAFPNGEKEGSPSRFNPKKDGEGLLRVDGRLRLADDLSYFTKHTILLPKDHAVTRLVVTDTHERIGHGSGVEHTLTELRAHFWIVKGRRVVRNIVEACSECRRRFSVKTAN